MRTNQTCARPAIAGAAITLRRSTIFAALQLTSPDRSFAGAFCPTTT